MRMCEVLLMEELHQPLSEINNMSEKQVHEYIIIIDELGKIRKEKMEEQRNA
jgi:hypothetical protein